MKVIITQPGTYNNEYGQPVRCAKGDALNTVAGYGQTLLDNGFARPVLAAPAPAPAPTPAAKPRGRKKATD